MVNMNFVIPKTVDPVRVKQYHSLHIAVFFTDTYTYGVMRTWFFEINPFVNLKTFNSDLAKHC